ncbi:MAG TPA: hypothetical protein ACFCUD_05670 [Cyclobacteriaceae bacterium]
MHLKVIILLFLLTVLVKISKAQFADQPEIDLETFIEEKFQILEEDINYDDLYESLYLFYTNPINLNNTTRGELISLYILSPEQVNNFFNYTEKNGKLLSIYELQAIPDFDLNTINRLLPFVVVREDKTDTRPLLNRILTERNNYFILRNIRNIEKKRGFKPRTEEEIIENTETGEVDTITNTSTPYAGDANRLYGRFRVSNTNDFSLGFTFEKDAGEAFTWDPNTNRYGLDYYSYHFFLENKGIIKKLAIGDFQAQFGQGLLMGAGFATGKGSATITSVMRTNTGLKPYSSVLESGFFRGIGTTINYGNIDYTVFYSRIKQDGNLQSDTTISTDFDEFVNSIQETGFHRTASEINNKNQITEQTYGANLLYRNDGNTLQLGVNFIGTNYSTPLQTRPRNYNQFEFEGDYNYNIGIYGNYYWRNFNFFGEAARSKSGGIGAIGGFAASLTHVIDLSFLLRNYDRDFHSFYGNAFGESSRIINESGLYWGIKIKPSKRYYLTAYYDKFNFPWLRFRTEAPSQGYEYLARFTYRPTRKIETFIQYRQEAKERTETFEEGDNLNRLVTGIKRNYWANVSYSVGNYLNLKSRVQFSNFDFNNEFSNGFAIYQDVNFTIDNFKISTRAALFDTDNFENAQYVYERDVLYAVSRPAYSGRGVRNYVIIQYRPVRDFTFWFRYARTRFSDRDVIGDGNERIDGDTRSEVRLQIRYIF